MKLPLTLLLLALLTTAQAQTHLDLDLNHLLHQQQRRIAGTGTDDPRIGGSSVPVPTTRPTRDTVPPLKIIEPKHAAPTREQQQVPVIARLQPDAQLPEATLQSLGITIQYRSRRFVAMSVPLESLSELAQMPEFAAIEQDHEQQLMNDFSRKVSHVTELQDPDQLEQQGIPQAYTGRGVIVGVHDSGIDFNHNNFRDPQTHQTRIKKAIVHGTEANTAQIVTDPVAIDQLTTDKTTGSHGTHTSSTAAGSYAGNYLLKSGDVAYTDIRGAAYEADLVLSGTPSLLNSQMMQSLDEMDQTATELNEPLVVNLSLGMISGWLDGKSNCAQFMDEFTDHGNKPGRIVCISAGNSGDYHNTIRAKLDEINNYAVVTFLPASGQDDDGYSYYQPNLIIYGDDATPFTVKLMYFKAGSLSYVSTVPSTTLVEDGYLTYDTYEAHDGRFAAKLKFDDNYYQVSNSENGDTDCAVVIQSEAPCGIRLIAYTPEGKSDVNLSDHGYAYRGVSAGDASSSINVLALTNSVLTVGAWNARSRFLCYENGKAYLYPNECNYGNYADFTSYVVADDNGIQKPDFCAPGVSVISGYNSYDTRLMNDDGTYISDVCGIAADSYLEGHTSLCGVMQGTSMSCPNAVGVIALWLQQCPTLTVNQIRDLVAATATTDYYTAASPARFGSGKINALAGLQALSNTTQPLYRKNYDINGDGTLTISDIATLVNYILRK